MKKIKILDLVFVLIFLVAVLFSWIIFFGKRKNSMTLMVRTPDSSYAYDLSVNGVYEFEGYIGKTKIVIENNTARVEDSDCENKICVSSGVLKKSGEWAACLPNGIIIFIEGKQDEELDALVN